MTESTAGTPRRESAIPRFVISLGVRPRISSLARSGAHIMLREELRKPLDEARTNQGIREYLQMRDGPFQPEPFGPKSKKKPE